MHELKILFRYFVNSLQMQLANLPGFTLFFVSKFTRYTLFTVFLYFLVSNITTIGTFSPNQMLIFYLVFNLIDTIGQMLFREVYSFRPLVVSGSFDLVLTKPSSPLIRVLFGGPDFIDLGILVILILVIVHLLRNYVHPQTINLLIFIFLIVNSLILAAAFHIFVLALGIITLSVDHLVMIYRDLTGLMRIPVDLFTDPLRTLLTFVIPLGIMLTFPAKALFGLLSPQFIIVSFALGLLSLLVSLHFWQFALKRYSSASS